MMSEILPKYQYTEPVKSEKINGRIYSMAAGIFKHADIIANLYGLLYTYLRGKPCKTYTSDLEISLDENSDFRPDISVICDFSKKQDDGYHGAPQLVIEVLSPSTAKRDRGDKFDCYQAYGVNELWLVSPEYETIEQYSYVNEAFATPVIHFKNGTSFHSTAFPDLEVYIDEVFAS